MQKFLAELKRRNVYKVAVAYAVVAWLLIQLASILFPTFEAPAWVMKVFIAAVALGFPLALILAWAFELTPEGIKRADDVAAYESIAPKTGRGLMLIVGIVGALALGLLLFQFSRARSGEAARVNPVTALRAVIPEKSIAILPFESLSEDKANAFFATGVQDEILTRLAKIADLKVISRTSTQRYKSAPENLPEVGRQLGVAHILEGSVQKAGDQVRINVQLINVATDAHLWAETYDRDVKEIFQVQSDVSERIASALEAKLTGRERQQIAAIGSTNPAAYEAYLRGLALDTAQSESDTERAREFFQQAVALDPSFARAWAALANREAWKYFAESKTPEQLARAQRAADTAMRLQPDASESHLAAGSVFYYCLQDFDRALAEFTQARERAPGNANAIAMIALVKRRQGRLEESIQISHEAANLDPRNTDVWMNLGRSQRGAQRFREARSMFDRALAILPGDVFIEAEKAESYLGEGDLENAEKALTRLPLRYSSRAFDKFMTLLVFQRNFSAAVKLISDELEGGKIEADEVSWARFDLALLQVAMGDAAAAKSELEEARRRFETRRQESDSSLDVSAALLTVTACLADRNGVEREAELLLRTTAKDLWRLPHSEEFVGRAFALLGDADRAIPHLERALTMPSQEGLTPAYLRLHPVWDRIRDDPRFVKLAQGR